MWTCNSRGVVEALVQGYSVQMPLLPERKPSARSTEDLYVIGGRYDIHCPHVGIYIPLFLPPVSV